MMANSYDSERLRDQEIGLIADRLDSEGFL